MKFMKLGMGVCSVAMVLSTMTPVSAESKATVYVVDRFKGDTYNYQSQTMTYNKSGLLTKVAQKSTGNLKSAQYYSYKNNRLSKVVYQSNASKETNTPLYKKGKLDQLTENFKDSNSTSRTIHQFYYSKGNIVKVKNTYLDISGNQVTYYHYKYKKGLLVEDEVTVYKNDAKGYVSYKEPFYLPGDYTDAAYFTNKYNSKGLLTAVYVKKLETYKQKMPKKAVLTVTYKKIKVAKSVVKKVKAQQKWILRGTGDYSIYNI